MFDGVGDWGKIMSVGVGDFGKVISAGVTQSLRFSAGAVLGDMA
jgi:hypothetical protein